MNHLWFSLYTASKLHVTYKNGTVSARLKSNFLRGYTDNTVLTEKWYSVCSFFEFEFWYSIHFIIMFSLARLWYGVAFYGTPYRIQTFPFLKSPNVNFYFWFFFMNKNFGAFPFPPTLTNLLREIWNFVNSYMIILQILRSDHQYFDKSLRLHVSKE